MNDYVQQRRDRAAFLSLKVRSGTATTAEREEYERAKTLRLTESFDGSVVYVEAPPLSVAQWNDIARRVNAERENAISPCENDETGQFFRHE